MAYCSGIESTTWANVDDLYSRFGAEYIDKLSTRTIFDSATGSYISDESTEGRFLVTATALCDAKELLRSKIMCRFGKIEKLDTDIFPAIKQWHIKLTIETLKANGDCYGCACVSDIDKFLDCGRICNENGSYCLPSNKTFFSVSKAKFPCESGGCECC